MTDNTKRLATVGGVTYRTYSDVDKCIDENDNSERVVIGRAQVPTGVISYTASKNWIARNIKHARAWQKERGYA